MINKFENLDCMIGMKEYPDKYFDLAIVDPPYFSGPDKLGYFGCKVSQTKVKRPQYKTLGKWDIPKEDYFIELLRVSKNQIIWGINYFNIVNLGEGRIVWDKINDFSTFSDGEIAYCSMIKTVRFIRYMWNGMLQGDMKNKEVRIHPTQKPVMLYKKLLKDYSKQGFKILDTHVGSASSLIAFEDFGLDYVGFEIDKNYYDKAKERLSNYKKQGLLFERSMPPQVQPPMPQVPPQGGGQ